jgi:glycosyltransferase involved in cell wall biosynthesis
MIPERTTDERPRLCMIMPHHWALCFGGAEYQAQCLADELNRSGKYRIVFVTRVAPFEPLSDGIEVVGISESPQRPRIGYLADALPLYRALKRARPDVIYQRVGCGYTAIAAHYARRNAVPMIWHVSSDTDVSPAMLIGSTNILTRLLEKKCVEFGLRNAHRIICQTNEQTKLLAQHYGRRADIVVPNFHPPPVETIDKTGPATVLWVANLKRLKRPEIFVRLAGTLSDLRGVRFVMVGSLGPGSRRDRTWHDQLLRGLRETPNLIYVGPQNQAQVNEWLARSHVLVSTSLQEGFPNTFIQAWMREVPVVSLHVNPDGVLDREHIGICVTSETQLTEAVRTMLTNPQLRAQYGASAEGYALEHHSLQNAQRIEQLFDSCLSAEKCAA